MLVLPTIQNGPLTINFNFFCANISRSCRESNMDSASYRTEHVSRGCTWNNDKSSMESKAASIRANQTDISAGAVLYISPRENTLLPLIALPPLHIWRLAFIPVPQTPPPTLGRSRSALMAFLKRHVDTDDVAAHISTANWFLDCTNEPGELFVTRLRHVRLFLSRAFPSKHPITGTCCLPRETRHS